MNLVVTLIIGGIIGWLASLVMKTNAQMGMIANIVIGIVGSAIGFWLAGALGLLLNDPHLYRSSDSLVIELRALVADMKKNPRRYLNVKVF